MTTTSLNPSDARTIFLTIFDGEVTLAFSCDKVGFEGEVFANTYYRRVYAERKQVLHILHECLSIIHKANFMFVPKLMATYRALTVVFHVHDTDETENPSENKSLVPKDYFEMLKQNQWQKVLAERAKLLEMAELLGYETPSKKRAT